MKPPIRTFGKIEFKPFKKETAAFEDDAWEGDQPAHFLITGAEPHVCIKLKSIFEKIPKSELDCFKIALLDDNCHDLLWFMDRYPMEIDKATESKLKSGRKRYLAKVQSLEKILSDKYIPRVVELKHPYHARDYQLKAAEMYLKTKKMLLCDDLGLGKSLSATLSFFDPKTLPALVVCQTHLPTQWKTDVIQKFTNLSVHIIKVGPIYQLPPADVYIISYSKLAKWGSVLHHVVKSIVFDEVQELRRTGSNGSYSNKYASAKNLCARVDYAIGLSGSPIYNYGIEMFNVLNCLKDGCIGSAIDFIREWGAKIIGNPKALGTYLRENYLLLRRTAKEVGRELPPINTIVTTVEYDHHIVEESEQIASQLALSYLEETDFFLKGQLGLELDKRARQNTGIGKAKSVAGLVRILLENNKPVVLSGWHRKVYEIWLQELKDFNPVLYTGTESPREKDEAKRKFVEGETDLFIISNRSGIGLDGLQNRLPELEPCCDVVIGELDWSPKVHDQIIGRVNRDGQTNQVTVYYPVVDEGSDPPIIEVLGIKSEQSAGIIDPLLEIGEQKRDESRIKLLAESYLKKKQSPAENNMIFLKHRMSRMPPLA